MPFYLMWAIFQTYQFSFEQELKYKNAKGKQIYIRDFVLSQQLVGPSSKKILFHAIVKTAITH